MTQLELIDGAVSTLERQGAFNQRLIDGLGGDPQAWTFTGEVLDAGPGVTSMFNPPKCACGHVIRYQYIVELEKPLGVLPAGTQKAIGNECIGHFADVAPEAGEAMKAKAAELAELAKREKREAKRRVDTEKARAAIAGYLRWMDAVLERRADDIDEGRRSVSAVYWACRKLPRGLKPYKQAGALIRAAETLEREWSFAAKAAGLAPVEASPADVQEVLNHAYGAEVEA